MRMKIRCKFCREQHDFNQKNFPIVLKEVKAIYEGRGKNRKLAAPQPVVVGFCCRKCLGKHELKKFIQENNITQAPGQRLMDAVRIRMKGMRDERYKKMLAKKIEPKTEYKKGFIARLRDRFRKPGETK